MVRIEASTSTLIAVFMIAAACSSAAFAYGQDAAQWDVTAPHGPVKTVEFSTSEGTWMNLDVSPEGTEIVFDLLGDLYVLPIEGGQARLLLGGPAFDIQPRYSPDGKHIAFTSDRAGGDNLWIVSRDGTDTTQVTKESFRLVNGPAWTPDGKYLLGRKHFTSTRSLGAGEVWMYHISGGAGLQLTKKKNSQQDQGNEIALSPDGRYVYFSEDISGGSTFQYNKDPHGRIYAIRRLDRVTGKVVTLVSGAGGAARPESSPDGRHLAFVRRVRSKSVLYLYDMASGAQRPLWDGLSHDQQEAWAIFGVYPGFDWTPDGKHIILWAEGKIWRVAITDGQVAEVPFTALVKQEVHETLRFRQEVFGASFDVRMIRDAVTSPDGGTLVFAALGTLWKKTLPSGESQRLTDDDVHEHEPAFSPDGKDVVYTTWSDSTLGAICRVPLAGGRCEQLTTRPGHYFTPRFSPDGSKIVYQRGTGNALRGTLHGTDPGLYWMASDGSAPHLITESGADPRFDATGKRIYFMAGGGLEKEYRSISLHGAEPRVHFTLKYPTEVVPSPDGTLVAFTELFNAYVAAFPATGGPVALAKDTKAIPVHQVSRDAGTSIHWTERGLHWVLGPRYFTHDVRGGFPVSGADSTGVPIGLVAASDRVTGAVAFTGAQVVTMRGDEVLQDATVVVEGSRIIAVGADVSIPEGALVIDAAGRTILPGIIDAHAHASHFVSGPLPQENWAYLANLAYGVTTAHDPSASTATVFTQSEMVRAGLLTGPRIFSTGTILYGADGDFKAVVNSLDDARSHLRRMQAVGAFSVKSYNQPRRNQRQQIVQAARELKMNVVPEGGSTFFHNITMILDGHTGIEHNLPVAPLYQDVLRLWVATEVGYTPTLVVSYGGLSGEFFWYQRDNVWEDERLLTFVPRGIVDARSRRRLMADADDYFYLEVARQTKKLVDQGNIVQVGAHGQMQGIAAHWELWMLHQGGMTSHEALRSATLHGAQYLGLDHELGSLEPGKLADLMVIDGDPLTDLYQSVNVAQVMVNGRLYDARTMDQIGNHPAPRGSLYWERHEVSEELLDHGPACVCGRH